MAAAAAALAARMARNSLRVMPGFMPAMVAYGAATDQAGAPRGAHSSLVFHIYYLAVQCLFEPARLALRRGEPGVTNQAAQLRVGARERAQQAQMNRVLQLRIPVVLRKKLLRRQFQHPGGLAYPRGCGMRGVFEDGEVAHQLAGPGQRHAPFQLLEFRNHLDGPAHDEKAGIGRGAGGEQPRAARQLQRGAARGELLDLAGVEALEERQERKKTAPRRRRRAARRVAQRVARGRCGTRRPVLLGRVIAHPCIQRTQLIGEHAGNAALRLERRRIAARHESAEIVARDEPALDRAARDDGRRADAALDQRHLAEHVALAELGDGQHAAAGQRYLRLDLARADQECAARGLALAHQPGAPGKRHGAGDRNKLVLKWSHAGRVNTRPQPMSPPIDANRLLAVVAEVAREARPHFEAYVALDSSLERELGLDSLARVELVLRLEREFAASLPEQALASSETPRDLLRFLLAGAGQAPKAADRTLASLVQAEGVRPPDSARTLTEALEYHAERQPERLTVHL